MDLKRVVAWLGWDELPPEFISSVIVCLAIIILSIVLHFKIKKYDPLKRPKGIVHLWEILVEFVDKQVASLMGEGFTHSVAGGYILALGFYIFVGFLWGMVGFPNIFQPGNRFTYTNTDGQILTGTLFLRPMPNPFTNTAMPLSIALLTFFWIHITSIKCKKWGYFKRYVQPMPFFLPINLITMWSGTLSLTLRLFGNALAGYCIITLIYSGFSQAFSVTGAGLAITPLIAPITHLYFDVFDGFIQVAVFCMLTMINVSTEYISKEDLQASKLAAIKEKEDRRKIKEEKRQRRLEKKSKAVRI